MPNFHFVVEVNQISASTRSFNVGNRGKKGDEENGGIGWRARYRVVLRIQSEEKGGKKRWMEMVGDGSLHRGPPVSDYRGLGPESD